MAAGECRSGRGLVHRPWLRSCSPAVALVRLITWQPVPARGMIEELPAGRAGKVSVH